MQNATKTPRKRRGNPEDYADPQLQPPPAPPLDDEPAEPSVFDLLDQLEGYKFALYRKLPGGEKAFLTEYHGDAFQLAAVKEQFGGGEYVVQRRTLTNQYDAQRRFLIDGAPISSIPGIRAAPPAAGGAAGQAPADVQQLVREAVQQALAELQPRQQEITVRDLLPHLLQPRPDSSLELLKVFVPLLAGKPQPISEVISALQAVDTMRGGAAAAAAAPGGGEAAWGEQLAAVLAQLPSAAAGLERLGWVKQPAAAPEPRQHPPHPHAPHQLPQRPAAAPPPPAAPAAPSAAPPPPPPAAPAAPPAEPAPAQDDAEQQQLAALRSVLELGAKRYELAEDDEERADTIATYANLVMDAVEDGGVQLEQLTAQGEAACTAMLLHVAPQLQERTAYTTALVKLIVESTAAAGAALELQAPAADVAGRIGKGGGA